MNTFTASNGITLTRDESGRVSASTFSLTKESARALAEFFRAEEDERLGRWRWPENSDYVVYVPHQGAPAVTVVNEFGGCSAQVTRNGVADRPNGQFFFEAARAYFDAHPEPKPWHDAKPGEVWLISYRGAESAVVIDEDRDFHIRGLGFRNILAPEITAGRRIWPEPDTTGGAS